MESLSRQCPEDGFASLDDYARYHYAHFGMRPEIIYEALMIGLNYSNFEWARKYEEYVDKVIGVRRRRARMERIILDGRGARPWSQNFSNFGWLFREEVVLNDHEIERTAILPAEGIVFTFHSQEKSRLEIAKDPREGRDTISISAEEGFVGPKWYGGLGHKAFVYLDIDGYYSLEVYDPWA